jgi:crotonobetainyl-CoA:carnitine CoA-transferase CaiB-like acyl-CoA transferase
MSLPLQNIKVLEFTHAVMGPTTGLLLADMGAEVIHIEPPQGDETRRLKGFGTGYFPFYSRNKKSLAIDIKSEEGKKIIYQLVEGSDIVVENFGPGTMDRLGFGYDKLKVINEKLIYCSLKGFASGPYQNRHAMDEVVQMMGGLAYMTGRPGDPLRAGTSIVDITGGMFGYIGILTALYEREKTGKGKLVKSSLFETTAFLMGQHMAYAAITKVPVPPMPARVSAWSIYKIFNTKDNDQIFIGIISEKHWQRFCETFEWKDWLNDERLKINNGRIDNREWFLPELNKRIATFTKKEIIQKCELADIPFAPIATPEDLFEDVQLNEGGSLLATTLPDGTETKLPKFPLEYEGAEMSVRLNPPRIGEHTNEILQSMGLTNEQIMELINKKIIVTK